MLKFVTIHNREFMRTIRQLLLVCVLSAVFTTNVVAQPTESSNYLIDEAFIGPGGTVDSNSSSYNLQGSLGDLGVGESSSPGYNLLAGYTTDAAPTLIFRVNSVVIDLGVLSTAQTMTGTATFSVGSYNSEGYVIQTVSTPPTYEGSTLDPITSASSSQTGVEQFGINLVANTSPAILGANPVQVPNSSFSSGYVASGYDTSDEYQYNQGDVIARSDESSGITDYTLSYIANISNITPSGDYRMEHFMVATSTF